MNYKQLSITQLHNLYKENKIGVFEFVNDLYNYIEKVDKDISAFITLTKDLALKKAKQLDNLDRSNFSLLTGIPLSIKDNILIKGYKTTAASKMLENFKAPYNATVIEKLAKHNPLFIGKVNLDEFAMGSSTENSAFFKTKNPLDTQRVPGGSSGGSAASVSSGQVLASLGSDTGGSIRQPAAFCGVFGLKPTYGLVSRYGLIAFASSLDQIGPLAKNPYDIAILLDAISGFDKYDSTSLNYKPDKSYFESLKDYKESKDYKIGYIKEFFNHESLDSSMKEHYSSFLKDLSKEGFSLHEVSIDYLNYALSVYYIIASAEASSNLARYDGVRYGYRDKQKDNVVDMMFSSRANFGKEVKRRIILGTYVLSAGYFDAYYLRAQKLRNLIFSSFKDIFRDFDLLLAPTTPTVAFKFLQKQSPLQMYLSDIYTIPVNLAGIPALAMPINYKVQNLPLSIQIMGDSLTEDKILKLATYIYKLDI